MYSVSDLKDRMILFLLVFSFLLWILHFLPQIGPGFRGLAVISWHLLGTILVM